MTNSNVLASSPKLKPEMAFMSSVYKDMYTNGKWKVAANCIDGSTLDDYCHTDLEPAPWLAISFGEGILASVEMVVLFNRDDCCGSRTRNVEVRLANEMPKSAEKMFSGGELLGTFEGPGSNGQRIRIKSGPGWENKHGHYLIIQMNNGNDPLHFMEVFIHGNVQSIGTCLFHILQVKNQTPQALTSIYFALILAPVVSFQSTPNAS